MTSCFSLLNQLDRVKTLSQRRSREITWLSKPWEHQLEDFEIATEPGRPGYCLFWEMGLGKTFMSVNVMRYKYQQVGRVLNTLILCPTVVVENWHREIKKFSHCGRDTVVLKGPGKKKTEQLLNLEPGRIVVTNYESLINNDLYKAVLKYKFDILICDEAHKLKNSASQTTRKVTTISKSCVYRLLLTGTPITNTPMDIYSIFKIMDGGETFGKSKMVFRNKYFWDKNAQFRNSNKYWPDWVPNELMYDEMSQKIKAGASIRKMSECRELPQLIKKIVTVELSPEQRRVYKELRKDFISYIEDRACMAQLAITKALRLMQIASGFVCLEDLEGQRENIPFKEIPRAVALRELLAEITTHSKCIVWAVFKDNYRTIAEVCDDIGVKFVEVHGGIASKDKQSKIDAFNNQEDIKVFIGNSDSAGLGCNLTSARYSIFYSRNFSLSQDLQAEKRNHRPGCEEHEHLVRIDMIAEDTIDERIAERILSKQVVSDKILHEVAHDI